MSRQNLRALSFEDGQPLWSCHLSGPEHSRWSIALAERSVVAFPTLSLLSEDETESMPVVVRRSDTGALVQRFVFPATIADVGLRLDAQGALLATSRALWALAERKVDPESEPGHASLKSRIRSPATPIEGNGRSHSTEVIKPPPRRSKPKDHPHLEITA